MEDNKVLQRIEALSEEELALEESHASAALSKDRHRRLHDIEVELDQCWDLLRQRRARRSAGQDPDDAQVRSETVVEQYLQ
ncbi:MAG TPA: DUF2630 family protein [Acidimicrobiales bacterium]